MIALKNLSSKFIKWNYKYGSPYGYKYNYFIEQIRKNLKNINNSINSTTLKKLDLKISGMFSLQPNSTTRTFEYPWAYYATDLKRGMNVIDIGGGLSGFQFVLSKNEINVINVDPSDKEFNWVYNNDLFNLLNSAFNTDVRLIPKYLDQANLKSDYYDRIYCISVLEHLTSKEQSTIIKEAYRLLKKGGYFVITLDLFLDIYPFSNEQKNKWGSNMNAAEILKTTKFSLVQGNKKELLGFPEFNIKNVMKNLSTYYIGATYPVLTQAFVLKK